MLVDALAAAYKRRPDAADEVVVTDNDHDANVTPWVLAARDAGGDGVERSAAILLDTSGDAAAAALGGADFECAAPEALQLPSFIFRMAGVDTREIRGFGRLHVTRAVAGAARQGELPAVTPQVVEGLFASDLAYLEDLYQRLNSPQRVTLGAVCPSCTE